MDIENAAAVHTAPIDTAACDSVNAITPRVAERLRARSSASEHR